MRNPFALNEEQVIALAGIFQALWLTHETALTGVCEQSALETSVASILRLEAPNVSAVYSGLGGLDRGLRSVVEQFSGEKQYQWMMQMAAAVMHLERHLRSREELQAELRQGIQSVQRQTELFQLSTEQTCKRLADLYADTLSTLKSRISVSGHPTVLQIPKTLIQVRTCLLAALRSVVLWRQLGGNQLQFILSRRRGCMLARGLLSAATLERG